MLANIASVVSFSLLAQVVGFVRTLVIAALFGASITLDAYYLALIVPALVSGVIGGALQAGFVPVYVRMLTDQSPAQAAALRGSVFWGLTIALSLVSLAAMALAQAWVPWVVSVANVNLLQLTAEASRITVFAIMLNSVGDYLGLVLNCHRRFTLAAAAPIANTLVSVPVLLVLGPSLQGLVISVVAGGAAQLAVVTFGMVAARLTLPIGFGSAKNDLLSVLNLAQPMVPGFLFTQLQLAYVQALPARLGDGAVSVFGYATRLQSVVEQALVIGVGTVLLPHLAEMVARGNRNEIARVIRQISGYAALAALVLSAGIWLIGREFVQLLLARGSFGEATSADVARIWFYLALGLFPFTVSTALSKLIMAIGRPGILAITAMLVLMAVYALGSILPAMFAGAGVALVIVIAQSLRLVLYAAWLRPMNLAQGRQPLL